MKNCSNCRDVSAGTCTNPESVARGRTVEASFSCASFTPKPANDTGRLGRTG